MLTLAQRQVRGPLGKAIAVTLDGGTHHVRCLSGSRKIGVSVGEQMAVVRQLEVQIAAADLPRPLFAGDQITLEGKRYRVNEEAAEDGGMLLIESVTYLGVA
jgi:hypothetical protein